MKRLVVTGLAWCFPLLPAKAQQSVYWNDPSQTDYSGLGPNGGTLVVPMVLLDGPPMPDIGTSFAITFTVSPISSFFVAPGTHEWLNTPIPENGYAGPTLGGLYPTNLYTGLPAENTAPLPRTFNGIEYAPGSEEAWWNEMINAGIIGYLGAFTITPGPLPDTPDGYQLVLADSGMDYGSWQNAAGNDDFLQAGFYSSPAHPTGGFNEAINWSFTAFAVDAPLNPTFQNPMWMALVRATWEPIPEPASSLLFLAAAGILWRRR